MNAHETLAKLVFKRLERFIKQHFTVLVAQGHVFVIGNKVNHLAEWDQLDALAGTCADMAAWPVTTLRSRLRQGSQLGAAGTLGFFQGFEQGFGSGRLDEKTDTAVFQ